MTCCAQRLVSIRACGVQAAEGGINVDYKGYDDLFVLSFQGIKPQIVFCAIASFLWIYRMKRM